MNLKYLLPALTVGVTLLAGCDKLPKRLRAATPTPTPTPVATPTPTPTPKPTPVPTPTPVAIDPSIQAIVLCYHRFEENPGRDGLGIRPAEFEQQMQTLKDKGITVVSMNDFLAWRRGEKSIPNPSAVISIDDGYLSGYEVAWPILKKFGYPFTMYIYTDYVKGGPKSGGKSMTWEQIAEMRDAGVDIASHTVSHSNLRSKQGKSEEQYHQWLEAELGESKKILEGKLGIKVTTLAYHYGNYNDEVKKVALENGYEAAFTVYGQHLHRTGDSTTIGRYAITSTNPKIFTSAVNFAGSAATGAEISVAPAPGVLTVPMQGETISDPRPEIKVNLASLGKLDPKSVEMRISGFGLVPATYEEASQLVSYKMHTQLREKEITVIVSGRANGRKAVTSWTFHFDPNAKPTPTPAPSLPPPPTPAAADEAGIPAMKPAQ